MQTFNTDFRSVRRARNTAKSAKSQDRRGLRLGVCSGSGFSLIELLVVVAIMLVVAAFAIPTLSKTMDAYRLHGTLNSAANLAQKCHMEAIKKNVSQRMHVSTVGNRVVLFVTDSNDAAAAPATNDAALSAQLWLPTQFSTPGVPTGGPTALTGTIMWGTALIPNVNVDPYFNSRGLPCLPGANGVCTLTSGFVYYFKYKNARSTRWSALSISPAGRIESWFWDGNAWGN